MLSIIRHKYIIKIQTVKKFIFLFLFCYSLSSFSQRIFEYSTTLSGSVATGKNLPMWATTSRYGIIPDSRNGLLYIGIFSDFNSQKKIQTAYGFAGAGYLAEYKNNILIDELYFNLKWLNVRLDLGMIHPKEEFNGISAHNGSFVASTNARTMPGYNLHSEYIDIPLTKNILSFKFNLSDYLMIDKRFVDNTRLHHKSLFFKITPHYQWEIIVGLGHWVEWAGTSPIYGKQPGNFSDYMKIFMARSGGNGATISDSLNALGNHLGSRYYRINYTTEKYMLSAYWDNFFEDGKMTKILRNFPDGTYGLYYEARNKKQWITDIIYEFTYSKYQSGRYHDRPATPEEMEKQDPNDYFYGRITLGGNDNYFNNGEYQSGWTYYGRTIGTPFITPCHPNADGIVLGVYNNRIVTHYLGIQGCVVHKIPYRLRLSYSLNYGTYNTPLENTFHQFSFGAETTVLNRKKAPFHIRIGIYGDYGKLYTHNTGLIISLIRKGII